MDFDEKEEHKKAQTKVVKNQHFSEEEYHTKSQNTEGSEDQVPSDEEDIYQSLDYVKGQTKGGFKHNPVDDLYYLEGGFVLPTDIYSNLYPH